MTTRQSLDAYLSCSYPFRVVPESGGAFLVDFPDLPGCYAQADRLEDVPRLAEKARTAWIRAAWEAGDDIPMPADTSMYSGRLLLRIPPSLHRLLAESAEHQGVSLNQYLLMLLSQRDSQARLEAKLDALVTAQPRQGQAARLAS